MVLFKVRHSPPLNDLVTQVPVQPVGTMTRRAVAESGRESASEKHLPTRLLQSTTLSHRKPT